MEVRIALNVTPFYSLKFTDGRISALAATTPIYLQESNISDKKRTVDTMIMVLWGIGGISVATWFDYAMLKAPNHSAWRVALAMQAFFLVIALILVYGCPDSSRCVTYIWIIVSIYPL
jgi:hypothetical protein